MRLETQLLFTVGAFKDHIGKIIEINEKKKTVTIGVDIMGRETPVKNLNFTDIKKI